jgi:hypothetical protein
MNFDRNGVLVTTSRPKPVLRKAYRTITVDSRDRDPTKYVKVNGGSAASDPGDYVVYFPRPFQKVTRIRLMNAALLGVQPSDTYIMMQIEGLNRIDECASGADRAGYVDSTFAKILNDRPVVATGAAYTFSTITGITNRTFQTVPLTNTTFISNGSVTPTNANLGTTTTFTYTGTYPLAGNAVTISGFTGGNSVFNGVFSVVSSTGSSFTVTQTIPGGLNPSAQTGITIQSLNSTSISTTVNTTTPSLNGAQANALLTNITFNAPNQYVVGQNVNVTGYTGVWAPLNGSYVVLSVTNAAVGQSTGYFTVASTAPVPTTAVTGTPITQPTYLLSVSANGASMTYQFNGTHNISIGETITVSGTGVAGGANMYGVVTSIPTASSLTLASSAVIPLTNVNTTGPGALVTVNNIQYSYQTQITTSFVTGQYLVITGLTTTGTNASAQILQSSNATGNSGTFETTNIIYSNGVPSTVATLTNTSGTAIISQAIYYNDMSYAPNITTYNPPIGTLDRLHITLRRHLPLSSVTTTNPTNAPITFGPAENTFTFEIEYIDNVFEDVSSFETRLDNADYTPRFQGNTA